MALDTTAPREPKQIVREHWSNRAADYDTRTHHAIHSEAQRQAWLALLGRLIGPVPKKVLDVGCGTGFLSLLAAELGHQVTGIDLAPPMLERARAKAAAANRTIDFRLGDAEQPGVPAGEYDVVVERHLVWTLPRPEAAVRNWRAALRPGGTLLMVEGSWATDRAPQPDYAPIADQLPFFGGVEGERLVQFLQQQGFGTVTLTPAMDAVLWGEEPAHPRYVVTAV